MVKFLPFTFNSVSLFGIRTHLFTFGIRSLIVRLSVVVMFAAVVVAVAFLGLPLLLLLLLFAGDSLSLALVAAEAGIPCARHPGVEGFFRRLVDVVIRVIGGEFRPCGPSRIEDVLVFIVVLAEVCFSL